MAEQKVDQERDFRKKEILKVLDLIENTDIRAEDLERGKKFSDREKVEREGGMERIQPRSQSHILTRAVQALTERRLVKSNLRGAAY